LVTALLLPLDSQRLAPLIRFKTVAFLTLSAKLFVRTFAWANAQELIVTRLFPMRIRRRGVEMRLLIEGNRVQARRTDSALLKAVAPGRSNGQQTY
jgi:hypothetical protein